MDAPARIEVQSGTRVIVTWEDGTRDVITAPELRAACPCAGCSSAGSSSRKPVLADPERIRIEDASMVGAYGVRFRFAPDSHTTGIFSFEQLRDLGGAMGRR